MRKLLLAFLMLSGVGFANQRAQGWCEAGAINLVIGGLPSTNLVQGSFPGCLVTVNIHGGGLATLFSDNSSTPLSNPFHGSLAGIWFFYAANNHYDITLCSDVLQNNTCNGPLAAFTLFDVLLSDPASSPGPSSVPSGGTGQSSFTLYGILYGNTTNPIQVTNAGAQYQILQAGAGGLPAFGPINLNQSAAVSGNLSVNNGGTGQSSFTANGMIYGNSSGPLQVTGAGSQYQVFQVGAGGVPTPGPLNLGQAAAVTGALGFLNGGTGASTQTGGAGILQVIQSAIGSVARSYKSKFSDIITPEDFGAVGDGSTDDSAAFQAAINATMGTNKCLVAEQKYAVHSTLNVTVGPFCLTGNGVILPVAASSGTTRGIFISGAKTSTTSTILTTLPLASRSLATTKTITFNPSATGFAVGDIVNLDYTFGTFVDSLPTHFEQNNQIQSISGAAVTFVDPVEIPMLNTQPNNITKLSMLSGISIHDINFDCSLSSGSATEASGMIASYTYQGSFYNIQASNCNAGILSVGFETFEGYIPQVSNIFAQDSGTSGSNAIALNQISGSGCNVNNIQASNGPASSGAFGIGINWVVGCNLNNFGAGGNFSRQIKFNGSGFINFSNFTGNGSTHSTGIGFTLGSYQINGAGLIGNNNLSNVGNGVGVWFAGEDDQYITLTGVKALSNGTFDVVLFPTDNHNTLTGVFTSVTPGIADAGESNRISLALGGQFAKTNGCTGVATSSVTLFMVFTPPGACTNTSLGNSAVFVVSQDGYVRGLQVAAGNAGHSAGSGIVVIGISGVGTTTLTCTIGTGTSCSDVIHEYPVFAGQLLYVQITTSASETLGNINVGFEY